MKSQEALKKIKWVVGGSEYDSYIYKYAKTIEKDLQFLEIIKKHLKITSQLDFNDKSIYTITMILTEHDKDFDIVWGGLKDGK